MGPVYFLLFSRSARVERDSVNSVVISSDPTNPTPHMMVAAFVGISPSRNGLIIRDSTVLPKIRGLSSLMTLLFAPVAEYRYVLYKSRCLYLR